MKKQIIKHYKMHKNSTLHFLDVLLIYRQQKKMLHTDQSLNHLFEKHNSLTASLRHTFLYVKAYFVYAVLRSIPLISQKCKINRDSTI